ncbi:MAG TPA: PRC-barrel domain-containing protein [Micropepsaceae bacterium]|nr:PRC-barrel domain-containing protein [Micropepsaceae bacterium]
MKIQLASAIALVSLALAAGPVVAATATKENNPPAAAAKSAPPAAGMISARDVPNAKTTLSSAKIVDLTGANVGSVDTVNLDPAGKPISFKVDVGGFLGVGAHDIALDANSLKWDPAKKVLITSMTKDQMKALPEIKG